MRKNFYPPKINVFSMSFACLLPHFSLFETGVYRSRLPPTVWYINDFNKAATRPAAPLTRFSTQCHCNCQAARRQPAYSSGVRARESSRVEGVAYLRRVAVSLYSYNGSDGAVHTVFTLAGSSISTVWRRECKAAQFVEMSGRQGIRRCTVFLRPCSARTVFRS